MSYRILIADDQMFMRLILTRLIEEMGWEKVGEAVNGNEAIEKYAELKPDLMLMNISLPLLSGIDALKVITKYDPAARVVMLSSIGQEYEVERALDLGAVNYILKPFKKEDLTAIVERAMSKLQVVIAGDEMSRRNYLARLIEENGYELIGEAMQGMEAIEMFKNLKPDVLVMDVAMPVLDGVEAFIKIKEQDPFPRIVLLADSSQTAAINRAQEAGATHILQRPFKKSELKAAIESALMEIKILVVDEQVVLRRTLARLIKENGWKMIGEASNGKEAIEMYSELKPDIVMMDVDMPEMNGLEVLKVIKQCDPKAHAIMISGTHESIAASLQAGAKAYVLKPFEDKHVSGAIRRLAGLLTWEKLRG